MEIVGLLVIVILITLIIFFSLAFMSRMPKEDRLTSFQDARLANQLGPVITETTVECGARNIKINELIRDCAGPNEIMCLSQNSCTVLNNTLEKMIKETLDKDLEYSLTIPRIQGNELITNFTTQGCINPRGFDTYTTPIVSRIGTTTINIRICN